MRGNRKLDGREAFALIPTGIGGCGTRWLYALGLDDGRIKVGMTHAPRDRFNRHWRNLDQRIAWAHIFAPIVGDFRRRPAFHVERRALELLKPVATRVEGKEVFHGLTRPQVLALVRQAYAEVV